VPSVASGTCDQATAALRAVHLVASCSPQFSDTVPVGQVIGTNPPAGQPVPRDSTVAVLVSKGPDLVTVPKVFPLPLDQASGGPYSMCAKCHDLNKVVSNTSFSQHGIHTLEGFSCSICHSAHGVPAGSAGLLGKRLVNFDVNVVAPNGGALSYNGSTCTLTCHMKNHNADGSVTSASQALRTVR